VIGENGRDGGQTRRTVSRRGKKEVPALTQEKFLRSARDLRELLADDGILMSEPTSRKVMAMAFSHRRNSLEHFDRALASGAISERWSGPWLVDYLLECYETEEFDIVWAREICDEIANGTNPEWMTIGRLDRMVEARPALGETLLADIVNGRGEARTDLVDMFAAQGVLTVNEFCDIALMRADRAVKAMIVRIVKFEKRTSGDHLQKTVAG
jgi:hypothetical protein